MVNAFIFLVLLATILTGVLATVLSNFKVLEVNPNSFMQKYPRIELPGVSHSTEFNESEWYPLVQKLQVQESCETGIVDSGDVCVGLDYKIEIQATSGNLRMSLLSEDTLLKDKIT